MSNNVKQNQYKTVVEDLFYQYARKLERDFAVEHGAVFIDGTKLESCAGPIPSVGVDTSSPQYGIVANTAADETGKRQTANTVFLKIDGLVSAN